MWVGLGNLESRLLSERLSAIQIKKPVYVAGLARSGTTILLELLARHPHLASHRYRDFPPVLTPWFWNWFVDRASVGGEAASERAHGDGIEVTSESPEAFEEVVWMAFFPGLHDPAVNSVLPGPHPQTAAAPGRATLSLQGELQSHSSRIPAKAVSRREVRIAGARSGLAHRIARATARAVLPRARA
jgi:hypothetical protein